MGKFPLASVTVEGGYQSRQHDVLAKFPNADQVALRQQELYYVCQTLNADKKLTTQQRLEAYHRAVVGLDPTRPASQPTGNKRQAHPPPAASSQSTNSAPSSVTVTQNCIGAGPCIANNSGPINIFGAAQAPDRNAIDDAGAFKDLPPGEIRVDLADMRREQKRYEARIQEVFHNEGWRIVRGYDNGTTTIVGDGYIGPMTGVSCATGSDIGVAMMGRLSLLGIKCNGNYQPVHIEESPADLYLEIGRIGDD